MLGNRTHSVVTGLGAIALGNLTQPSTFLDKAIIVAGNLTQLSVLGLILGYSMSYLISLTPFETEALPTVKTMPVNFQVSFYVIGIIFAMISTFFAGFFPARKAQSIDPVDIIRGQ